MPGNQPQGCCAEQVPDVQYCAANSSAVICSPTDLLPPDDGCAGSGPAGVQPNLVQPGNKELAKAHPHLISGDGSLCGELWSSVDLVLPLPHADGPFPAHLPQEVL